MATAYTMRALAFKSTYNGGGAIEAEGTSSGISCGSAGFDANAGAMLPIGATTATGVRVGKSGGNLGFFGTTPIAQGAGVADATDAASAITQLNALISRMEAVGLIATV
jgi:hypothetical protein